jgi:uroporphyrinogen-III synthase
MKAPYHIVSTKVLSQELVQQFKAIGVSVTQHDFINTCIQLPENLLRETIQDVVVLTSKTAVEAWVQLVDLLQLNRKQYRVYCLSEGTQELVLSSGFTVAGMATNSALLADQILKDKNITSVTFVCGNRRRDELTTKLKAGGVTINEIVAYKTELTPLAITSPIDGVLFFSPSGVDSFLSKNSVELAVAFCLGKTTAKHAQEMGFKTIRMADAHTPAALVKSVIDHCKNQIVYA